METGHVSNPRVTLAIRDGLSACGFPGSPAPWDRPADKDDPHPSLLVGGKGEICRVGFQKRRADRRNRAFLGWRMRRDFLRAKIMGGLWSHNPPLRAYPLPSR